MTNPTSETVKMDIMNRVMKNEISYLHLKLIETIFSEDKIRHEINRSKRSDSQRRVQNNWNISPKNYLGRLRLWLPPPGNVVSLSYQSQLELIIIAVKF